MGSFKHTKTTKRKRNLGKVDALLNEKLQKVEWGDFKIEDVLDWQPQKEIDPLKLKELTDETEMIYPFYGQATTNNGIISYNQLTKSVLNNEKGKPTILIHSNNQNIIYLETPFYLKDGHGATSVLQSDKLNKTNQMFIIGAIDRVIKTKYSYNNKATKIELKNSIINLPIKKGKIDYEFMESFIAELEAQRIAELENYLLASGLKDYNLTYEEQKVLEDFENGNLNWKEFLMGDLFEFKAIKQAKSQGNIPTDNTEFGIPYVVQTLSNNMVSRNVNKSWLINNNESPVSGNRIVLGVTLPAISYQPREFGASQVITGTADWMNNVNGNFISVVISKLMYQFSYGSKPGMQIYKDMKIQLPANKNKPKYGLMEIFITAIQKLVIKEVVLYADRKIEATKLATQN